MQPSPRKLEWDSGQSGALLQKTALRTVTQQFCSFAIWLGRLNTPNCRQRLHSAAPDLSLVCPRLQTCRTPGWPLSAAHSTDKHLSRLAGLAVRRAAVSEPWIAVVSSSLLRAPHWTAEPWTEAKLTPGYFVTCQTRLKLFLHATRGNGIIQQNLIHVITFFISKQL